MRSAQFTNEVVRRDTFHPGRGRRKPCGRRAAGLCVSRRAQESTTVSFDAVVVARLGWGPWYCDTISPVRAHAMTAPTTGYRRGGVRIPGRLAVPPRPGRVRSYNRHPPCPPPENSSPAAVLAAFFHPDGCRMRDTGFCPVRIVAVDETAHTELAATALHDTPWRGSGRCDRIAVSFHSATFTRQSACGLRIERFQVGAIVGTNTLPL